MSNENSEYHISYNLPENVTAEAYKVAIKSLLEFSRKDLHSITTLEELAEAATGVGAAFRDITLSKGVIKPEEVYRHEPTMEEIENEEGVVTFKISGGDAIFKFTTPEKDISLRTNSRHTAWDSENEEIFTEIIGQGLAVQSRVPNYYYAVTVPVSSIAESQGGLFDISVSAGEYIYEQWLYYLPRKHLVNTQILKRYGKLLQQATRDVSALNLPPPAEIPRAFLE